MSVSKRFITPANVRKIVAAYCADDKPTLEQLATTFKTTYHTVQYIVKNNLSARRYTTEKQLRYSRSKLGSNSPMWGKSGPLHHNWIGDVDDGYGYKTRKVGRARYFVHRIVMAEALGIHPSQLPATLMIHHIDGNPLNNSLDNLALVTNVGHQELHQKRSKLQRSPLWVQWVSGTSKLRKTTHT